MMNMKSRLNRLTSALSGFFRADNHRLREAIEKTVDEGFFGQKDVQHRILSLKQSLNVSDIVLLSNRIEEYGRNLSDRNVICLHAGNIPMAGVEDLITIILTGASWKGKISRKDPWLLPIFADSLADAGFRGISCSTDLAFFKDLKADALLFSGSVRSEKNVIQIADSLNIVERTAAKLVRTTWYSLAYLNNDKPENMMALVEAVFRYGGRGCRSVGAVISPFPLNEIKCELTDYIEQFWLHNPQHQKPSAALYHRSAYNKSVGHPQAWLDDFLIEQTRMLPLEPFVLHWIEGGFEDVKPFINDFSTGLQTVYVTDSADIQNGYANTEPLSEAQKPPVYWKPDGIDTVRWLFDNIQP